MRRVGGQTRLRRRDDDVLEQPAEYLTALFGAPAASDYHYREDAIGRRYKYDAYGNRVYSKPLHGSKRPPTIPDKEWRKLKKPTQLAIYQQWKKLEGEASKDKDMTI